MKRKGLMAALLAMLTMGAGTAAAQFLAADLIYLPAATHTNGEGTSRWRSEQREVYRPLDVAWGPGG